MTVPTAPAGDADGLPGTLSRAISRLRRDPWLFVPFLLAGALLSALDRLHRHDPLPAVERAGLGGDGITVDLEFAGYPAGVSGTTVSLESLIGLQPPVLVWGVGSYALALGVVGVAGAITMARAMRSNEATEPSAVLRYLGYVVAMDLAYRLVGSIDLLQGMGLWGLPLLAGFLFVLVRLFAVPGLLVAGQPLGSAVRESARLTRGRGWRVFSVILLVGLGAWLLASVPGVGAVLSSVLVAPVHAVTIVAFLEDEID